MFNSVSKYLDKSEYSYNFESDKNGVHHFSFNKMLDFFDCKVTLVVSEKEKFIEFFMFTPAIVTKEREPEVLKFINHVNYSTSPANLSLLNDGIIIQKGVVFFARKFSDKIFSFSLLCSFCVFDRAYPYFLELENDKSSKLDDVIHNFDSDLEEFLTNIMNEN